jgi:hypothetical protein
MNVLFIEICCSKTIMQNPIKNPAARGKAKRRGRNREEAKPSILDDTSFFNLVYSLFIGILGNPKVATFLPPDLA